MGQGRLVQGPDQLFRPIQNALRAAEHHKAAFGMHIHITYRHNQPAGLQELCRCGRFRGHIPYAALFQLLDALGAATSRVFPSKR